MEYVWNQHIMDQLGQRHMWAEWEIYNYISYHSYSWKWHWWLKYLLHNQYQFECIYIIKPALKFYYFSRTSIPESEMNAVDHAMKHSCLITLIIILLIISLSNLSEIRWLIKTYQALELLRNFHVKIHVSKQVFFKCLLICWQHASFAYYFSPQMIFLWNSFLTLSTLYCYITHTQILSSFP